MARNEELETYTSCSGIASFLGNEAWAMGTEQYRKLRREVHMILIAAGVAIRQWAASPSCR
jgi:hypothetical protein